MYYFVVGMFTMFIMGFGVGIVTEKKISEKQQLLEAKQLNLKIVNKE